MDTSLVLSEAPPLHPVWLAHEKEAGLLGPQRAFANIADRQPVYSQACKERNARMLAGRDKHLTEGIDISDSIITARDGHQIKIRRYKAVGASEKSDTACQQPFVIYYHGGGLRVGDLDSEDLSCRRICKEVSITVISVDYRLMPQSPPQKSVDDVFDAFLSISMGIQSSGPVILVGSSSGAQLAAQVAQLVRDTTPQQGKKISGLLLRCPVTIDAGNGGIHIPERFQTMHTSLAPSFETSLLKIDADTARFKAPNLPLEAPSFPQMPRTYIQVCTNDIYYSDGICYAAALQEAGVSVRVKVIHGWPHTFWLKAPQLDQALEAESDMIHGLNWLLEANGDTAQRERNLPKGKP